jgi:hypothetical protein
MAKYLLQAARILLFAFGKLIQKPDCMKFAKLLDEISQKMNGIDIFLTNLIELPALSGRIHSPQIISDPKGLTDL